MLFRRQEAGSITDTVRGATGGPKPDRKKSDTDRSGKVRLPRWRGEAGTQRLAKLLPGRGWGCWVRCRTEAWQAGVGLCSRASEQASGLRALWELAGRDNRQGAGPAPERSR